MSDTVQRYRGPHPVVSIIEYPAIINGLKLKPLQ